MASSRSRIPPPGRQTRPTGDGRPGRLVAARPIASVGRETAGSRRGGGRDLKTARAVLRVLRLLEARGEVDATEVATELEKSHATATYLLNSLVAEGFAERDPAGARGRVRAVRPACATPTRARLPSPGIQAELESGLRELYRRSGARSYLGLFDRDLIVVADSVGRQGLARIPGLGPVIQREAHCLAIGKVVLAEIGLTEWRRRTGTRSLAQFTAASITDPGLLEGELAVVRRSGVALDCEEFSDGVCCIAAPVRDGEDVLIGTLAISVPTTRFREDHDRLVSLVREITTRLSTSPPVARPASDAGSLTSG